MSIFPKKITSGESCIIHLRFANSGESNEIVKYILKVINPNNEIVLDINKSMILGIAKDNNFVREIYYDVKTNEDFMPGKYIVDFHLYCKGIKVESMTKENDYFNIEKLSYFIENDNTYIINESKEDIEFYIYNDKSKIKHYKIKGKDSLVLNGIFNYIQYANNKIDIINKRSKNVFYKNPEYKIKDNRLINVNTNKEYKLSKEEINYYNNVGNIIDSIPSDYNKMIENGIFLSINERNIV